MPKRNGNGFSAYKNLLLSEIRDLKKEVGDLAKGQVKLLVEIERLKIKASLWGAAAGGIPVIAYILIKEFSP